MITLDFSKFTKPVKFYSYSSRVMNPIIEVDATDDSKLTWDERDLIDNINDLFERAHKLNRKKFGEDGYIQCTTRSDNKTTIAMSDGKVTLYFGKRDLYYKVGFSARHLYGDEYVIDLSDLKELPILK